MLDRIKRRLEKARRLGYIERPAPFAVNPKIQGHAVHVGGRVFKKGTCYAPVLENISSGKLEEMMSLNFNGLPFFVELSPQKDGTDYGSGRGDGSTTEAKPGSAGGGISAKKGGN